MLKIENFLHDSWVCSEPCQRCEMTLFVWQSSEYYSVLTHFCPIFPFYIPLKYHFSGVFRGYEMGILARNGLFFYPVYENRFTLFKFVACFSITLVGVSYNNTVILRTKKIIIAQFLFIWDVLLSSFWF